MLTSFFLSLLQFLFPKVKFKPFHVGCKILLRAFELLNVSNKRHIHPLLQPGKVMPVSYSSFSPVLLFALLCDTLYRNLNWHTNQFFHRTTGGLIHQFKLWSLFFLQSEFSYFQNKFRQAWRCALIGQTSVHCKAGLNFYDIRFASWNIVLSVDCWTKLSLIIFYLISTKIKS